MKYEKKGITHHLMFKKVWFTVYFGGFIHNLYLLPRIKTNRQGKWFADEGSRNYQFYFFWLKNSMTIGVNFNIYY